MPLSVRPFQYSDAGPLLSRFAQEARPPWIRLPYPYAIEDLVVNREGLIVLVAETSPERVVGLVAIDAREAAASVGGGAPCMIGPLLSNDQLADLFGKALMNAALAWATEADLPALEAKVDLGEDRGLQLYLGQGFKLQGTRQYVLAARKGKHQAPEPLDGLRIGPCPDMLSSDYQRLYAEIGAAAGWTERAEWTRPQLFEHLKRQAVALYAVRAGDTFLGFAELEAREPGEAELTHFGILPAFRGRGVAKALLGHVIAHATESLGLERVWLVATTDESGQLAFDPAKHGLRQERALVWLEKKLAEG